MATVPREIDLFELMHAAACCYLEPLDALPLCPHCNLPLASVTVRKRGGRLCGRLVCESCQYARPASDNVP